MDTDEKHIQEFRYIIQKIKKDLIQRKTLESQNTSYLLTVLEPELHKLFLLLRPIIEQYKPVSTLPDEDLQQLFYRTLEEYPRTAMYQNNLLYYLNRDLIEYPLVIDNKIIDEYKKYKEPNGMPTVIENNTELTLE